MLNVLLVLQKRALRIILKTDFSISSDVLFQRSGVVPKTRRWQNVNIILIFKCLHNLVPNYLSNRISLQNHLYSLRNSLVKIHLPLPKTNFKRNSFIYSSAILFNNLPLHIRQIDVPNTFIRKLNKFNVP